MIYKFKNEEIYYKFFDRKSDVTNVFLHGWGCDSKSLLFCNKYAHANNLFLDFPPFGESSKDISGWTIFTYANMVISLCEHLGLKKINVIGHSFGGRVAIIMSVLCKEMVQKIVLIDSAGLKPKRSLSYYLKVLTYKIRKRLGLDVSKYGSCDYLALSPQMRKIFSSVVSTHLDDFLPFIKCETLIMFGKDDKVTPVYMAKKLKKKIKKSRLVLFEDAGHFCFVDKKLEFVSEISQFLNS